MLSETDQLRYGSMFEPYLKGHAGQYVYHLKQEDLPIHLQQIGADMQGLLRELQGAYEQETVYADGGYGGPQSDPVLQEQDVALIQTAIRGQKRNPELLYLDDFAPAQEDEQDVPQQMTCPAGQTLRVALSASGKTYQADLPPEVCAGCEQRARCFLQHRAGV